MAEAVPASGLEREEASASSCVPVRAGGGGPRGLLRLYYGLTEARDPDPSLPVSPLPPNPQTDTDIDGGSFSPDLYLNKLRRECGLAELMDSEAEMVKQIRALDSDMQTLVYENYNKFISATDTIRKMKNDFKKMEDEMDCLTTNMAAITAFSASISHVLQHQHQQITKLSGVHTLLRKLQFLFELPSRLNTCVEMGAYGQAVRYYSKARCVLHQYQHMPSFHGIQHDCQLIMASLALTLRDRFSDGGSSPQDLAECVELLLRLEEPAEGLCDEFLAHAERRLSEELSGLERELGSGGDSGPLSDVLEFTDKSCNGFVSNTCLVMASYQDLFIGRSAQGPVSAMAKGKLVGFVDRLMATYFSLMERRVALERKSLGDNSLLVRSLDRFHRRLQAVAKLLPGSGVAAEGTAIVVRAAKQRLAQYLLAMKNFFADCLTDVRQSLAAPRLPGKDQPSLADLLTSVSTAVLNQIKSVLAHVHLFTAKDITFSSKAYFKGEFCSQGVREGLIVAFIRYLCQTARGFCESGGERGATPPALLLILSRLCLDYETSTISYILTLTDEQFLGQDPSPVTPVTVLCSDARVTAQKLLNHQVKVQGLNISQMLRKSVETRDWVSTVEPRNVRAVMKRVVEDITAIDLQVGLLYEEGVRKAHSSDSSKRTFSVYSYSCSRQPTHYSYTPSAPMDTNLLSNIQKLFSERIDIFSSVEFNKVSVLTGIIKISLKTFLECVRLRTFGRYGLQQIQVDCHYLQLYLWHFVSDENLVHFLLDEIVGSAAHRCLDPVTMEQSVIEVICERG